MSAVLMDYRVAIAKSLDALLVLGGEGDDHSRSFLTYHLYSQVNSLPIVLAGAHGGLDNIVHEKTESERMKEFLVQLGVPEDNLYLETRSKDTLANIVYARPILEQLGARKIGLITERDHMRRSLWLAREVLGRSYGVRPLPTEKRMSTLGKVMEFALQRVLELELHPAMSGNQKAFEKYLAEKHPFHGNGHIGAYNMGARLMRWLRFSYDERR